MSEASNAAIKLANDLGIEIEAVTGTGANGLVTKEDVSRAHAPIAQTNIMAKAKSERAKNAPDTAPSSQVIHVPDSKELLDMIANMRGEIEELREKTYGMEAREAQTRDLTDEYFFIARPGRKNWEERRVVDGRTVDIQFSATEFLGPFENEEDIETYVGFKRQMREDSYIDWQNFEVITGREARERDSAEKTEREAQFGSSAPVNALDRRIFADQHGNDRIGGVGQVVGNAA
jgi:hypothetical protein